MVENAVYVTEQLTHFESHNLTGYSSCGFTIKSTDGERGSLVQQLSDVNEIFKETSIIDEVKNKFGRRQTLAEMQQLVKNDQEPEQQPIMRLEQAKIIKSFVNPFKMLYLWGSQEALDLKALLECVTQIEGLEERRIKLMK